MVGGHQLQGLAADDPDAVEHAAIEQHLAEPRVIHRGRDQTAAAGFHHRRFQHVEELNFFAAPGIDRERLGEPVGILRTGVKRGLGHLQRCKDALGQEGAEGFAGDDFDEAAENVGGAAVVPFGARLTHQRQARDQCGVFGVADLAAAHPRPLVKLLHQAVAGMLVGDARGVPQQILDRDRPLWRHKLKLAVVFDADFLVGKFRNVFGNRIVEQEIAFLEQHHDADGDDRLGHGEDAEQGIVRHRRRAGGILPAERVEPADLTAAGDHHGHARRGSLVDVALERVRHPLQPDRRKAERFRFGLGEGRSLRGGGRSGGGLGGHGLSPSCSCCRSDRYHRGRPSLTQNNWVEQGVSRFALAIWPWPMLETGEISGDAWFR